jgi:hypothetical protein
MCKEKTLPNDSLVNKNLIRKIETVTDAVFEQYDGLLLGFLIEKGCWFSNTQILHLDSAIALTSDYKFDELYLSAGDKSVQELGDRISIVAELIVGQVPIISHHQRFDRFKVKRSDLLPIVSLSIRRQLPIQYLGKYKGCLLLTK